MLKKDAKFTIFRLFKARSRGPCWKGHIYSGWNQIAWSQCRIFLIYYSPFTVDVTASSAQEKFATYEKRKKQLLLGIIE